MQSATPHENGFHRWPGLRDHLVDKKVLASR